MNAVFVTNVSSINTAAVGVSVDIIIGRFWP